jgi:hypothetical protein
MSTDHPALVVPDIPAGTELPSTVEQEHAHTVRETDLPDQPRSTSHQPVDATDVTAGSSAEASAAPRQRDDGGELRQQHYDSLLDADHAGTEQPPTDAAPVAGLMAPVQASGDQTRSEHVGELSQHTDAALPHLMTADHPVSGHEAAGSTTFALPPATDQQDVEPHDRASPAPADTTIGIPADVTSDAIDNSPPNTGQAADGPRYGAEELTATGRTAPRSGSQELMLGVDGRDHLVGDRHGTFRDRLGDLHNVDGGGYARVDRADGIAELTEGPSVYVIPDQASSSGEAFSKGVTDQNDAWTAKDQVWTSQVVPLTAKLNEAGLTVDKSTFGSGDFAAFRAQAEEVLSLREMAALETAKDDYRAADARLHAASERLGQLAGDYITERMFPTATVVTGGKDERGRSGEHDRILYIPGDNPAVLVVEEKGAGSKAGTRNVDNPIDPTGPQITARQCSPEYVHGVLRVDNALAAAIRKDPDLGDVLQRTVTGANNGSLQCYMVRGMTNGKIKLTEMLLDPVRLVRESIRLAGYKERDQR